MVDRFEDMIQLGDRQILGIANILKILNYDNLFMQKDFDRICDAQIRNEEVGFSKRGDLELSDIEGGLLKLRKTKCEFYCRGERIRGAGGKIAIS